MCVFLSVCVCVSVFACACASRWECMRDSKEKGYKTLNVNQKAFQCELVESKMRVKCIEEGTREREREHVQERQRN